MSGDESDTQDGSPRYVIYQYDWRSDLSEWLQLFDKIYQLSKLDGFGTRSRGNSSRIRVATTTTERRVGKPVPGLPANWYNEKWLSDLEPWEKEDLQMEPDVPLVHSEAVKQ